MCGSLDEYWIPKSGDPTNTEISFNTYELVAFSHSIIKGKALRGMWFYQMEKVSRYMIWYHSARTAIQRSFLMNLELIDIGPSYDSNVMNTKEKISFQRSTDWRSSYEGEFRDIPNELRFKFGGNQFL